MALFEVIIPSTLTTNITSNNQKKQRSYSGCIPVLPWDGLGTCPVLYAKSAKTGTASCDYLITVTRCWRKKCFSEEWKSTESSICSPHAVLQLILSSAVQIHKALTKYCSLRSARHLIIFLLNWVCPLGSTFLFPLAAYECHPTTRKEDKTQCLKNFFTALTNKSSQKLH